MTEDIKTEVRITLKKGMVDAEGETVKKALHLLGFPVEHVETVQTYILTVKANSAKDAEREAENACKKLLANPVIQDFTIKVL